MIPAYLSPEVPRWQPANEADLRQSIIDGVLSEGHYLEFKQELASGAGSNKELARDLASLALDGGSLVIGIGEDKPTGSLRLRPVPLTGLAERVDQIARSIPDPPIAVTTRSIPSAIAGHGYLLVHVPESPTAPHMVDHRYLGRGDRTKTYLSDSDVRRYHERYLSRVANAAELLRAAIERDPVANEDAAHLFGVAQPLAARADLALQLLTDPENQRRLLELALEAQANFSPTLSTLLGFAPDLKAATQLTRRVDGIALSSHNLNAARQKVEHGDVAEVEFLENGGVRFFMSRLSDSLSEHGPVIFEVAPVLWARLLVALATSMAEETGYLGSWAIGIGATGLQGKTFYRATQNWLSHSRSTLDAATYMESTVVSFQDLSHTPGSVTNRLVGRLTRALGAAEAFHAALTDDE